MAGATNVTNNTLHAVVMCMCMCTRQERVTNTPLPGMPLAGKAHSSCCPLRPPYYPFNRGKIHTRGNIWSFTVG